MTDYPLKPTIPKRFIVEALNDLDDRVGGASSDIPSLTDVDDATVPTSGHYLRADGTDWANSAILEADIPAAIARDTEVTTAISDHSADTTSVHGITDTSQVALKNDSNIFTVDQEMRQTDTPPILRIRRDASGAPAGTDILGRFLFQGEDSANNALSYAEIRAVIDDPTDASEDGQIDLFVVSAGTLSRALRVSRDSGGRARIALGNDLDTYWTGGTGSPEGVVTAGVGSMYSRTDGGAGTSLYVKESGAGNTGWVAK